MRFTDFHSNGPMCTPTRAALMTGRYPQRGLWVPDKELSPVFVKQRRENMKQDCIKDQPERVKELARLHEEWLREVGNR